MAIRLGNVLYWLGCILAFPFIGLVFYVGAGPEWRWAPIYLVPAGLMWLAGRTLRYILAGT